MAFKPTTQDLWLEISAAIKETEEHVEACNDLERRITGRWFRKDLGEMEPEPENFGYALMSNLLPTLSTGHPGAKVEAARIIGHKVIAQAMEDGVQASIEDLDWNGIHDSVLVDFMTARGVTVHWLAEDARFSRGTVRPMVRRVDKRHFFMDALAEDTINDQFRGHWYWVDLDDLQNDPRIKPEVLASLTPGEDVAITSQTRKGAFNRKSGSALGRKRIKCFSVWIRQTNTIRVLVEGILPQELYDEFQWWGPPCGPYQLYDAYPVPGRPWPLSPMVAVEDQSRDLNIHARAMGRAAARRKSVGLVEATATDLGDKITDAEDGEILPVKGITGNYAVLELGTATDKTYQYVEYIRNRLDRISGLTATIQGSVGDANTATEAKIADDALGARIKYLKRQVMTATEQSLWKIGWFDFHTEGIIIPVNRRDPYSGEQVEGLFFGGPWPTDAGASWDDFQIKIRVNTMQEEFNARDNMVQYYTLWVQVMQMAPMMPYARWMNVLRDLADAFKVPNKADEWTIPELFGAFSQPPMAPPSQVMGRRPLPQRGGQPQMAGAMQRPGQMSKPGSEPGQAQNNIGQGGQVSGPRPQQVSKGGTMGFNPMNRVA